jgi:hypothetical protein
LRIDVAHGSARKTYFNSLLVVIWGAPKCGKSFWTFDLTMHIARGQGYRGQRVRQGVVVYVACEGERGFKARAEAYRQKFLGEEESVANFYFLPTRLDLVEDEQLLIEDIRLQLQPVQPAAIVIDTLNRSLAGSESSDKDMGAYIKAADAIRETFRCAVLIVHHCGIDDKRPRGHTSLTGAADAQIAVKRDEAGLITSEVEYLKDGAEGHEFHSWLRVVPLCQDEDGEDITSCVVEPAKDYEIPTQTKKKKKRISPEALRALDFLTDTVADHGQPLNRPGMPAVRATTLDLWRDRLKQRGLYDGDAKGRQDFRRLKQRLIAETLITIDGNLVWRVP